MKSSHVDDFTRVLGTTGERITRRALLRALGIGGAATYLASDRAVRRAAGQTAAAQADATPAASPDSRTRPPGGPSVGQRAFDLEYDVAKIFQFIADEVRYDPYAGVLRGAKGTLAGLAGNSADQAVLLAALLEEAYVETRFVIGTLDSEVATRLLDGTRLDLDATREAVTKSLLSPSDENPDIVAPDITPELRTFLDSLPAERERLVTTVKAQLAAGLATVDNGLAQAAITLPEPVFALPDRELNQHVWVQYAASADWIDLDPSIPETIPGETYAIQTETLHELPPDLFHRVAFRVVAEVITGGQPARIDVLSHEAKSADLAGVLVAFAHVQPEALRAAGVAVAGAIEGTTQYIPNLIIDDEVIAGTILTFGTGAGLLEALGGEATPEGEAIAEWLEIDLMTPDHPSRRVVRAVFDRVDPALRLTGEVDLASLAPIELSEVPGLGNVYPPLEGVVVIGVAGGETPLSYFQQDYTVADPIADMALLPYAYQTVRMLLGTDIAGDMGYRFYLDEPNLTAFWVTPLELSADQARHGVAIDLIHQGYGAIPITDSAPAAHPGVIAGVFAHVVERSLLGETIPAPGAPPTIAFSSVGGLFEVAAAEGVTVRTLAPGKQAPSDLQISDPARLLIDQALAAGQVVIIPERSIELNGTSLVGWWTIDPATGRTGDLLETGRAAQTSDYIVIVINNVRYRITFVRLGLCVVAAAAQAGTILNIAGAIASTGAENPTARAILIGATSAGTALGGATYAVALSACAG